jgi:hypothetical protein
MRAAGRSPDDRLVHPAPSRTLAFLVVACAVVAVGSMAWPRPAASDGVTTPTRATVMAPPSPTTSVATGPDPGLLAAFERAAAAARDAGHHLTVTSGFRTAAEQERLLADEVAERGPVEALRWVFPPDRSMHVRGLALDVGDGPAADWLDDHGARFGLCRTLAWEWWHFEWRQAWEDAGTCPGPVDDPADAPS